MYKAVSRWLFKNFAATKSNTDVAVVLLLTGKPTGHTTTGPTTPTPMQANIGGGSAPSVPPVRPVNM
jgi:hypothetical protein